MLPLLDGAARAAAEHRLERLVHRLQGRKQVGHLLHALRLLAPMQHREALRADEVRRIDAAQLPVELREDHVEVDRGPLGGHDDHDHVPHAAMLEHQITEVVERGRTGALAEPQQEQVGAERVDVAALERVVVALLFRAVVQDPRVLETGVIAEQRLDEQLLGPAHAVAHRADDRMLPDHDAHVAREEQIGKRRQRIAALVERARDGARLLEGAFDHEADERLGWELGQLPGQGVRRHHLERARDQELAHIGPRHQLGEERAHFVHLGEALEHGDETAVLLLRQLQVDDVVVQVGLAVARRDRKQLGTRGMHEHRAQRTDFGGDADAGHGRECNRARSTGSPARS